MFQRWSFLFGLLTTLLVASATTLTSPTAQAFSTKDRFAKLQRPLLAFTGNTSKAKPGDRISLSWAAARAHGCKASGSWNGEVGLQGRKFITIDPQQRASKFELTCWNAVGSTSKTVSFGASESRATAAVNSRTTRSTGSAATVSRGDLYTSRPTTRPKVIPFQPAFARDSAVWTVRFKVDRVGTEQALLSYDERGQRANGHTTLTLDANKRLSLRHQGPKGQSYRLRSRSSIQAGREYTVQIAFAAGKRLSLAVNGVEEDVINGAWGTARLERPMVLGASCAVCRHGDVAPLVVPFQGWLQFSIDRYQQPDQRNTAPQRNIANISTAEHNTALAQRGTNNRTGAPSSRQRQPADSTKAKPTLNLESSTSSVPAGRSFTLTWQSQHTDRCNASGDWRGQLPTSGSRTLAAGSATGNYTLTCAGSNGSVVSILAVPVAAARQSGTVALRWLAPTSRTDGQPLRNIAGYRIYYGTQPGSYSESVAVVNPKATRYELELERGEYYIAMTTLDATQQESELSNEIVRQTQ